MWIKVDDSFINHPKVLKGAEALGEFGFGRLVGGWLSGQSYACKHQTDGHLPARIARRIDDPHPMDVVAALVSAGLWEAVEGGYQIHDFSDYNPKSEQVKSARKASLARQQAYLSRRYDRKINGSDGSNNGVNNAVNDAIPGTRYPVPVLSIPAGAGGDAWGEWTEAWQKAGHRVLPVACPKVDEPKFCEFVRRFPDSEWRRLLLHGFFTTANEDIRAKPPGVGWFLYWADWIDEQYRKAGKRPKSEASV